MIDKPAPLRVLVVDDVRDTADSFAKLVGMWGHDCRVAYDGMTALAIVDQYAPNAILLDIGLPGLNGVELARQLKTKSDGVKSLIIVVTGHTDEELRRCSKEAGADFYLLKPADPRVIENLLAGHALGVDASNMTLQRAIA